MGFEVRAAALGAVIIAGLGCVVLNVLGQIAVDEAANALFRRPTLAMRRRRHRGLMKTGFLCGALALLSAFLWLAVITNDFHDDGSDARMFLWLTAILGLSAVWLLVAWWVRAGEPPQ